LIGTLAFVFGFSFVFTLTGLGFTALISALGKVKPWLLMFSGIGFALFGLKMMGTVKEGRLAHLLNRSVALNWSGQRAPLYLRNFLFGSFFGLSWTPCVGPIVGGVMTYAASREASPMRGAFMLFTFSMGIGLPLLLVALGSNWIEPILKKTKKLLPRIEAATGFLLFIFGVFVFNQTRLQVVFTNPNPTSSNLVAVTPQGEQKSLGLESSGGTRMIFFYSKNCPICHAMDEFLPEFEKTCQSNQFTVIRANVDQPANYAASEHFGVKAVPTIVFLDKNGEAFIRLVGYQPESRLKEAAQRTSGLICQKQDDLYEHTPNEKELLQDRACSVGKVC
jgi:cytochrome c-type biogenesis protein